MKFRAHETFSIRKGWLYKGMKNVLLKPNVFTDNKTQNPMDTLGIGANMVKSLRYWMQAVTLTKETKSGTRVQSLSELGEIIWGNDRYIEEIGTLWFLHYKLVKDSDEIATAWHFFFNEFGLNEFKKEDFVSSIGNYIKIKCYDEVADSSLESDFDCIINTYVSRRKVNHEKVHPENNMDCPFSELGLIDIISKRDKTYKKCVPKKERLHPLIILAVILDNACEQKEIRISSLQSDAGNIGKVFNLDSVALTDYLYQIASLGFIKVIKTAGLDVVKIETNMSFLDCVKLYYNQIDQFLGVSV